METFGLRNRYGKTQNTPVSIFFVTSETFLQYCCKTNISINGGGGVTPRCSSPCLLDFDSLLQPESPIDERLEATEWHLLCPRQFMCVILGMECYLKIRPLGWRRAGVASASLTRLQVTPFDNVHAFPKRDINNSKTFMRASTKVKNIPSLLNRAF
jgi:hypothetical protein